MRAPAAEELRLAADFLQQQTQHFRETDPAADPRQRALESLCHALINSNEFVYVE